MSKEVNKIKTRVTKHDAEISKLQEENKKMAEQIKKNTLDIKKSKKREIIRLLEEKKINGNYMYSYQEIGATVEVSAATVSNIAKEENLSRKSIV